MRLHEHDNIHYRILFEIRLSREEAIFQHVEYREKRGSVSAAIFCLWRRVLLEVKPVSSLFVSCLFHALVFCAALDLQLSLLF